MLSPAYITPVPVAEEQFAFPTGPTAAAPARATVRAGPQYTLTSLMSLQALATSRGCNPLFYKQESERFGLGNIKAFGCVHALQQRATDDTQGVSVVRGERDCRRGIYGHEHVTAARADAVSDAAMWRALQAPERNGWRVTSGTSRSSYGESPGWVMQGYSFIDEEIRNQTPDAPPTHVLLQAHIDGEASQVAVCVG